MSGRYVAAKTLQAAGLVVTALALVIGIGEDDMSRELLTLGLGAAVFLLGRSLEPREG